jgi:hypothetical protein
MSHEPAWSATVTLADGAMFGAAVAGGGDANGDGFADVMVGAPFGDGNAYFYYGNGLGGIPKSVRPRQLNISAEVPISHLGNSDRADAVRLSGRLYSPFGYAWMKLEYEVKPVGTPFDGLDTVQYESYQANGFNLMQQIPVTPGQAYHWRARTLFRPNLFPFQKTGRWFSIPWNGATEADFKTEAAITLTAPNGGEQWTRNSFRYITWTSSPGVGDTVKLKLFKNGVLNRWISGGTANNGSYKWKVPNDLPIANDYTIQVYSASQMTIDDFSDSKFSVVQAPITLTHPNGAERFSPGDSVLVTWTSESSVGQYVKLKLFKGTSSTPTLWISGKTENDGSLTWRVPADLASGDDYRIQIYSYDDGNQLDYSDNYFSISTDRLKMTYPNGGEIIGQGSRVDITWESGGTMGTSARLKLFKEGSSTPIWITGGTPNNGSYSWTFPSDLPVGKYRIQVSAYLDSTTVFSDHSDAYFSVTAPPVTMTAPNGGETWQVGTSHSITWTCTGDIGTKVNLRLYKNGVFDSWIAYGTANDGEFSWKLPAGLTPGADYKILIYSVSNTGLKDYSDDNFAVSAP